MAIRNNPIATTNPGPADDYSRGYRIGSKWWNSLLEAEFACQDATTGAAQWSPITEFEAWNSGEWKLPANFAGATNQVITTADTLVFMPFRILTRVVVDALAISVKTAAAGAAFRLGLFDNDPILNIPRNRIGNGGALDASVTTGTRSLSIAATLKRGIPWGAVGIKGVGSPATVSCLTGVTGDFIRAANLTSLVNNGNALRYYKASAYNYAVDGMPTVAPALVASDGGDGVVIALRRA